MLIIIFKAAQNSNAFNAFELKWFMCFQEFCHQLKARYSYKCVYLLRDWLVCLQLEKLLVLISATTKLVSVI